MGQKLIIMEDLIIKVESIIEVGNEFGLSAEILSEAFQILKDNPYYEIEYCLDTAFERQL